MATLTTITTGMEKGPEAIDANDKALNADIATLLNGEKLTWVDLPLESGVTGKLSVAAGYGGIVYIKGQVSGSFTSGKVLAKTAGTPLANLQWVDMAAVVAPPTGVASLQANDSGTLNIYGISGTATQINVSGLFAK
jgi:hypothetical protein